MPFSTFRRVKRVRSRFASASRTGYRPWLEFLESRLAPATLTVNTTADDLTPNDGSVSLREAITAINAGNSLGDPDIIAENPGTFGTHDTIQFNIPGTGVQTIGVGSSGLGRLPGISAPVLIDGSTQPGISGTPVIELDGAAAGAKAAGLEFQGGNSEVRNLAINRFTSDGVWLDTNGGDSVASCFIGTNAQGTLVLSNFGNGVFIDKVANNTLLNNLIGGNSNNGILIQGAGATGNSVSINDIGTNLAGTAFLANNLDGVLIVNAANNTLNSNVIAANGANGVHIQGPSATGNDLESNHIGLASLGNSANGVFIDGAPGNKIGSAVSPNNIIIANGNDGILIQGSGASGNSVLGNDIGTDGSAKLGNLHDGIHIDNAPSNVIGGSNGTPNTQVNAIAGNGGDGISIGGAGATGNLVSGNDIGLVRSPSGGMILGNQGNGVTISSASNNMIEVGVIEASGNNGVLIVGASSTNNEVRDGQIIDNTNDGIRIDSAPNNRIIGVSIDANGANGVHLTGTGANGNVIHGVAAAISNGGKGNALYGIVLEGPQVQNNLIGGTNPGDGNHIANNGKGGVVIFGSQNTGNAILGNDIDDQQSGLGIDLVLSTTYPISDGVTRPNTPGGPHVGPNHLQNFPVLLSATPLPPASGQITGGERVHGFLNSTPNTAFRLEFFSRGNPLVEIFLGATNVTTDSQGNVTFTADLMAPGAMGPPSAFPGDPVTATATDSSNNTSEFSPEIRADLGVDLVGRAAQSGEVWLGKSTGSSFTNQLWTAWVPSVNWVDVQTGDFNGDGRADIAGRDLRTGNWWVALSTGSAFTNQLWTTWSTGVTWVDVTVGDFNGDGSADIAGRAKETGQWWVALSNGSGFANQLWATWSTAVTWVNVLAGQFTVDPRTDIAGRALELGQWWVAQSTGSNFTNKLWTTWSTAVNWLDVRVGDFNGDHLQDIAGRADLTGQWWVALSDGSQFNNQLWTTWSTRVTWVDVVVGDFNGDGSMDIAGRTLESGQWWIALSNGSSFVNQFWVAWATNVNWTDIQVGDFNDDGKMDIAGRVRDTGQWWVALSNGSTFTNQLWGGWSTSMTWVDVSTGRF